MCRTYSPYTIKGNYFSLRASSQIKISTSNLCLLAEPSHTFVSKNIALWAEKPYLSMRSLF